MPMTDIMFCAIVIPLAILSTVATFVWKGLKWIAFVAAILWLLVGVFTITNIGVFAYQGYLSLIFFGLAVAMLFMPWAIKEGSIEEPDDVEMGSVWDEEDETYASGYEKLGKKKGKK
jgi:hypothetical protein